MSFLDRDGVKVYYEARGAGEPILFTHGFSATGAMFSSTADALADRYEVITWDLRGHGQSDYPEDPDCYSVPISVADMAGILDARGTEQAVVAGHSVGGYLSLEFYLAHPDRVRALVLIDTGPGYRKDDARAKWNEMAESFARAYEERGLDALGKSAELDREAHRDASGLIHAARRILVQHNSRVMDALSNITCPTLVIVGELDKAYLQSADYFAAKIPDATLVVVPGAGHAPNLSNPAVFNEAVASFMAGLAGR